MRRSPGLERTHAGTTILPNVVIAGTPKAGTSSLFRWLAAHPQVIGSKSKETRFLLGRDNPLFPRDCNYHDHGVEAYGRCFPGKAASGGTAVIVESTPHYLYEKTAREVLAGFDPQPKIIVLLRRPSDRIYSSFLYTKNNLGLLPAKLSFREFVESVLGGATDPSQAPETGTLVRRELRYSCYLDYLEPWLEAFPRNKLEVLLFEELRRVPLEVTSRLAVELGLDPAFYESHDFSAYNVTMAVRNSRVQRLVRRVGRLIPGGRIRELLKGRYVSRQSKRGRAIRSEDDMAVLAELDRAYSPLNERLGDRLGMDLSVWARKRP